MNKFFLFGLLCSATVLSLAQPPVITSWGINSSGQTGYGGILANCQSVQYDTNNVYISCTCIPAYSIGPWTGDPNVPSNQNFVYTITRKPVQNTLTPVGVGLGHIGVLKNGVSIFNSQDANSYNNLGYWHQNAFYFEGSSFDACEGHPAPGGEYHNHTNPKCLYNDLDSLQHSPIIAYAFDGFPVYGCYGYANTTGGGGIKRMNSSYQKRTSMVNRDTLPNGTVLSSADYGPPVSSSYPLGDYVEDYRYVAGSGDLDDHNGRFCITPDYPTGIYAYFTTLDASLQPAYPYMIGLSYYGVVQSGNTGPGSGHNTIPSGTVTYFPSSVATFQNNLKLEVFPNPGNGIFNVSAFGENDLEFRITNSIGMELMVLKTTESTLHAVINLQNYPCDVYYLHLGSLKGQLVRKLVKIE